MKQAVKVLQAEKAWQKGWTGKGVRVAVLDTGVAKHPDLKNRMVCFRDFVNGSQTCYDDYGHGTHVSGILCGEGILQKEYRGIAPGADLISLKVLDKNAEARDTKLGLSGLYQEDR